MTPSINPTATSATPTKIPTLNPTATTLNPALSTDPTHAPNSNQTINPTAATASPTQVPINPTNNTSWSPTSSPTLNSIVILFVMW